MTEKTLFIVLDQDMIKTLDHATEAWDALLKSSEADNKLAKAILTQALVMIGQKVHEAYEKSRDAEWPTDGPTGVIGPCGGDPGAGPVDQDERPS